MIFQIKLKQVEENYLTLKESLPKAIIAYAIKANYDEKILSTLAGLGCVAEVCSDYEHGLAIKAGFTKVIRNGYGQLRKAWLTNIELISQRKEVNGLVGARLRLSPKSKLGLDETEILKHEWNCISIHTREDFKQALTKAEAIAEKVGAEYVDAGGSVSKDRIELLKNKEGIIVEPGRYMVSNACQVTSKVLAVKEDKLIIDAGMNLLNKFSNNQYTVKALKPGKKNHAYRVFGPIPTDIDNIGTHNLPELKPGDKVIIENAGAYTTSMASNWTHKKPKIEYL